MLMARSLAAGTFSFTGSLSASASGGMETPGRPLKVRARSESGGDPRAFGPQGDMGRPDFHGFLP